MCRVTLHDQFPVAFYDDRVDPHKGSYIAVIDQGEIVLGQVRVLPARPARRPVSCADCLDGTGPPHA